jgi:hypothetical protein
VKNSAEMTKEKLRLLINAAGVHFAVGFERDVAVTAADRNGRVQAVLQEDGVFQIGPLLECQPITTIVPIKHGTERS